MINLNSNFSAAMASYRLEKTNFDLSKSTVRLSNGLKINSAIEDPGGLAVSMRLSNKVLQSSALNKNLSNTLSFLETQETYLKQIGKILTRVDEIDIQKKDLIKNGYDTAVYDNERSNLISEIYKIRDEKFNGVRLFSPDSDMDSMDADTGLINSAAETVSQFNLTNQNDPKPLEMIFLADISGSMGPYIDNVVSNISSFINSVSTRLNASSWTAKAVGYRLDGSVASPTHTFRAPNGGAFVSSIPDLSSQLTSLRGQVTGGVGGLGESLIDGVYDAINVAGGWQNTDSQKVLIGFTDEPSESPLQPGVTINGVASQLSSDDVNFYLFTNDPLDSETGQLTSLSGATVGSLASANADMSAALNGIVDSLITTELIDFDTLAQYIAQNAAEQNRVKNLISSNDLLKNNATEALGEIQDIDVAQESIQFSRLKILQEAGVAYAAHSNVSKNTYIKLFE